MLDDDESKSSSQQPRILALRAGGDDDDLGEGEAFFNVTEEQLRAPKERRRRRERDANRTGKTSPAPIPTPRLAGLGAPKPAATNAPTTPRPAAPRPRPAVPRPVLQRLRRRRRRALIAFTAFAAVSVFLVDSATLYLRHRLGQIPRIDVPSLSPDESGDVMNVLLVGSDSRERLQGADARQAGKGLVTGQRSDTIMVLHIDPRRKQAAILSIPRDLYVPVVDGTGSDRINAAFAAGGPDRLIATIRKSLGITLHHYIQVDFLGFKDIVDTVGGVEIYLPARVRDFTSGLDIPKTGCVTLDGQEGLAWVRSRHLETLVDGRWITDPRADLGRIQRQQDFIRRMLKKALSAGISNPLQLNRLIGIGVDDVTLDEDLSTRDLTTLARRFDNLDADSVALFTLPTAPADIGGASVLQLKEPEARPILDRINGIEPTVAEPVPDPVTTSTVPSRMVGPANVKVRVLNGTGTKGAAARAGKDVTGAGFVVTGVGDATAAPKTIIRYRPERRVRAELLAQSLLGPAVLVEDRTLSTANDVLLVVGSDFTGVKAGILPAVPEPLSPSTGGNGTTPTTLALPPTTTTTIPPVITPVIAPPGAPAPTC